MRKKTAKKLLKKVVKDYDNIAKEFNTSRKYSWREFESFLPHIKTDDYIADLGCGNGRFLQFLKDKKIKIKYIGIDNSKNLLKAAKKSHGKTQFIHGDLINLPLENSHLDTIASIASFHHIPSKELRNKAAGEMYRILKPNGILLITVWNLFQPKYKKYIWQSRIKSLFSFGKYDLRDTLIPWGKEGVKRYYYAFTAKEIKSLLEKNGFKILEEKKGNNFTLICQKQLKS